MHSLLAAAAIRSYRRSALLLVVLGCGAVLGISQTPGDQCTRKDPFPQTCSPFNFPKRHPIDKVCGASGDADDPGDAAQDRAKNNLCGGLLTQIGVDDLGSLQDVVILATAPCPEPRIRRDSQVGRSTRFTPFRFVRRTASRSALLTTRSYGRISDYRSTDGRPLLWTHDTVERVVFVGCSLEATRAALRRGHPRVR